MADDTPAAAETSAADENLRGVASAMATAALERAEGRLTPPPKMSSSEQSGEVSAGRVGEGSASRV